MGGLHEGLIRLADERAIIMAKLFFEFDTGQSLMFLLFRVFSYKKLKYTNIFFKFITKKAK